MPNSGPGVDLGVPLGLSQNAGIDDDVECIHGEVALTRWTASPKPGHR